MSIEKAFWVNCSVSEETLCADEPETGSSSSEPRAKDVELVQEKLALAAQLVVNLRSYALDGAPEPVVIADTATRIERIMREVAELAY